MRAYILQLKKIAEPYGFKYIGLTKKHHLKFSNGNRIVIAASSPSDFRGIKNFQKHLRNNSSCI